MTNSGKDGQGSNLLSVVVMVLLLLGALAVWLILRRGEQGWMTAKPSAAGQHAGSGAAALSGTPASQVAVAAGSSSSESSLEAPGAAAAMAGSGGSGAGSGQACVSPGNAPHSETQPESAPVFSKLGTKVTTEVTATGVPGGGKDHSCHVEWILRVTPAHGETRQVTVSDGEDGGNEDNTFDIIGWSADGDRLLTSMASVQGDYEDRVPVVYSLKSGKLWPVDIESALKKFMKRDCELFGSPVGFTPEGLLVIDVNSDEDLAPGQSACITNGR